MCIVLKWECSTWFPQSCKVFVDSQGLEVCIWIVFVISRCTQQQETTFWLYDVPAGVTQWCFTCKITWAVELIVSTFPTSIRVIYGVLFVGAKAALHSHKMNGLRSNSLFTVICCIQFTLFPLSIPGVFYIPTVLINCEKKRVHSILYTIL